MPEHKAGGEAERQYLIFVVPYLPDKVQWINPVFFAFHMGIHFRKITHKERQQNRAKSGNKKERRMPIKLIRHI